MLSNGSTASDGLSGRSGATWPVACASIANFPLSLTGPSTLSVLGSIPIAGLGTSGAASFAASFSVSISGYTMLVSLVGQEIAREYAQIPEPGTAGLVVMGLAGLGAIAARRRR